MVKAMSETITIPKEEYRTLMEFKRIVELEYELPLSRKLLKKLEEARNDIQAGKGIVLCSTGEIRQYFQRM